MPVYDGNSKAKDLYYGGTKIKEAYYGSTKVYSSVPLYYCYTGYDTILSSSTYIYTQNLITTTGTISFKRCSAYTNRATSSSDLTGQINLSVSNISTTSFSGSNGYITVTYTRLPSGDLYT